MNQNAKPAVVNGWQKWAGLLLPLFAALLFWLTPLGRGLEALSFDLLFPLRQPVCPPDVVIVYMDERSHRELRQQPNNWDRALHARLLERLTQDHARAVVFDIFFAEPRSPDTDEDFRQAIQNNGRVVLAAARSVRNLPGLRVNALEKPLATFGAAAAGWGVAELVPDRDSVVRRICLDADLGLGFAKARSLLEAAAPKPAPKQPRSIWLNYYGPQGTLRNLSYCDVSLQPPGFFRDRVVFVGNLPKILHHGDETDEFNTPYTRWGGARFPGVEVLATSYLNLTRGELLERLHPALELLALAVCGLLLGYFTPGMRPGPLLLLSGVGVLAVLLFVKVLQGQHLWFSWVLIAGVQIPVALAWRIQAALARASWKEDLSPYFSADKKHRIPNVPDHVLLSRIGLGAYGEVWLARNTLGLFRAVKFVFRDRYQSAEPYDREFGGIQSYLPISLDHPWLVHVLHVGRNDRHGHFYYIMEAGDDETAGAQIDPARYQPKNLSKELARRVRLPVEECVQMGLHLTTALDHLHQHGLIHRDIKPSNIIYIGGIPKLADIGLVTEMQAGARSSCHVGTDGYIPPEGAGTAAGDVYSLGKVLYEVSMGRDRKQYPDLPTSVLEGDAEPGLLQLNEIILKACESDPAQRYPSAAGIRADLVRLQNSLPKAPIDLTPGREDARPQRG